MAMITKTTGWRLRRWAVLLLVLASGGTAAFLGGGCSDRGSSPQAPPAPAPHLTALSPDSGAVGDAIAVLGEDLGSLQGTSQLLFGLLTATTVSWSDTLIGGIVPAGATSGPVRVVVAGDTSNSLTFRVIGTPPALPVLTALVPVRTVVGDTLRILGTGFGSAQGGRQVLFASARSPAFGRARLARASVPAAVLAWSEDSVQVRVPSGAVDGDVVVEDGGEVSNGLAFSVAPALISYSSQVDPLWTGYGCTGCHIGAGGSGGLSVTTYQELMRGDSEHGPVVLPRHGDESIVVRKLRGTGTTPEAGFGVRMPDGGPYLPEDPQIQLIVDWINQGARNN